ncbi:alpha/beta hydrolase [Methylosinus sp. Ce-a6]|uniref:RBBP9/YdeN family alpha/beta hydrolase n=1 Tax=Methylosinus sp. Ce-a6 TaxID=2172005 RepID=UPI001356A592|nr:alpha/beta fold hydrolase [Methylosinus sp. Ce-a6]
MRAADADILILPGLGGSGLEHWQTRWAKKLSTARCVAQADFDAPRFAEWIETIEREIAGATRPVVLVTHSLGGIAALHVAARGSDKIAAAFLVTPPSERAIEALTAIDRAFLPIPRARLRFPAILVASSDDPHADADFSRGLAEEIGAELVDAGAAGHVNAESGHGPWPEGSLRFAGFLSKL